MSDTKDFLLENGVLKKYGDVSAGSQRYVTSAKIFKHISKIDANALKDCRFLKTITLHDGIKEIDFCAFADCCALCEINVIPEESENAVYKLVWSFLSDAQKTNIMIYALETGTHLESLKSKIIRNRDKIIPAIISADNQSAMAALFAILRNLDSDKLDSYLSLSIDSPAVRALILNYKNERCSHFTESTAESELDSKPATVAAYKKIFTLRINGEEITVTKYKGSDTSVEIPQQIGRYAVTEIGCAFKNFRNIEAVILPPSIKRIGRNAFYNCANLKSVVIHEGVEYIGEGAFSGCSSLEYVAINYPQTTIANNAFEHCDSLTDGNGIFSIGDRIFWVRSDILEYCIPNGIKIVDDGAAHNRAITNLNPTQHKVSLFIFKEFAKNAEKVYLPSYITNIPDGQLNRGFGDFECFGFCSYNYSLHEVSFSDAMSEIGNFAFAYCKNLESVHLNNSLIRIGQSAFKRTKIKEVDIPASVQTIEYGAFYHCSELDTVILHEGIKEIWSEAFAYCSSLKSIFIPASVTRIAYNAFTNKKEKTIHAPAGSYAEQYAKENNIPFVAESRRA